MSDPVISLFRVLMSAHAKQAAARVLDSGYVGEGPEVAEFERELAAELGVLAEQVVTVNSCTSALTLALHLVGAADGDEVVTTPMTCAATNCPIVTHGARPVWADVDPLTGLISPAGVAKNIGSRTRAVIAVDWGGRSCDYAALREAAPGIPIIEDAAQRAPIRLSPTEPNLLGHANFVCLSFQAIKFVTTCDGGALICSPADAQRARLLRWYGLSRAVSGEARVQQAIGEAGYKFHMNDLAAAIGRSNLPQAAWAVERHRAHAAIYTRELTGLPGVALPALVPDSHFWLYTVLVEDADSFIAHLAASGIEASRVHARNDNHPALGASSTSLPGVDHFAGREVCIPIGWWLTESNIARVIDSVKSWAGSARPQAPLRNTG